MVDHHDRVCVPVEMEMIPLYREPAWSARLRREQKREARRRRRLASPRRAIRVRLAIVTRAGARRERTS